MRISDWSSDVCSSDLHCGAAMPSDRHGRLSSVARYARTFVASNDLPFEERYRSYVQVFGQESLDRSHERRVGKECSVRVYIVGRRISKNKKTAEDMTHNKPAS